MERENQRDKFNYLENINKKKALLKYNLLGFKSPYYLYNSFIMKKFLEVLIKKGKKHKSEKLIQTIFLSINKYNRVLKQKTDIDYRINFIMLILHAVKVLKIPLEYKNTTLGAKYSRTTLVPKLSYVQHTKSLKRLINFSKKKKLYKSFEKTFIIHLKALFFLDLNSSRGLKKKQEIIENTLENRTTIKYKWR